MLGSSLQQIIRQSTFQWRRYNSDVFFFVIIWSMSFIGAKEDTVREWCYSLMVKKQTHKKDKQTNKQERGMKALQISRSPSNLKRFSMQLQFWICCNTNNMKSNKFRFFLGIFSWKSLLSSGLSCQKTELERQRWKEAINFI